MNTQPSCRRFLLAFALAGLIIYGYAFVPHSAEYTKEMQRFTHTSRGFALLVGIVISFSLVSKFIFVDLWHWRETRRDRKKTRSV